VLRFGGAYKDSSVDFFQALQAAREASAEGPVSVHGRRVAVFDLLADSKAQFIKGAGDVTAFAGIPVCYDETMAVGMVEFRYDNGRPPRRLVQVSGKWYEFDTERAGLTLSR
jgi:hypothetical protein